MLMSSLQANHLPEESSSPGDGPASLGPCWRQPRASETSSGKGREEELVGLYIEGVRYQGGGSWLS